MSVDILVGIFLIALGIFLFKRGHIGGVVPFTREERPILFYATVLIAIIGGVYRFLSGLIGA